MKDFFHRIQEECKKNGELDMGNMYKLHCRALLWGVCLLLFACSCCLAGCGAEETKREKLKDLEYDILEEQDIPKEFLAVIEEKKETMFKLTYTDKEYLYIGAGYWVQETGGYSISVNDCYLTKNAIYFDTTLIGPSKGEKINQVKSYPYLVIRTKYLEKNVVFQ